MNSYEMPLKELLIKLLNESSEARELVIKAYKEWEKSQEDSKKNEIKKIENLIADLNKKYNTNYYLSEYATITKDLFNEDYVTLNPYITINTITTNTTDPKVEGKH